MYSNIQCVFSTYSSKYRLVFDSDQILPFIHCATCGLFRFFYKLDPHGKIRNNSRTNIENHRCIVAPQNPRITSYDKPANMTLKMRQAITNIFAEELGASPTMSIQATTDFFNNTIQKIQPLILSNGHPIKFDISRQSVANKIREYGQNLKNRNIEYFNQHLNSSCIIFDHWSQNGQNFLSAIGRTATNDLEFSEYVLGFFKANVDKTANGYLEDLDKLLTNSTKCEIPLMCDNCPSMRKAGRISNKFKKIFCAAHKLATINDKIHKLPEISEIDNCLTKVNSYFNYRHELFNLPLKPQNSTSSTRSWRSHSENYSISIRNYDRYEELLISQSDFPLLPDATKLRQLHNFQQKLCHSFDILEKKDSDLLDQLNVYITVSKLSVEPECTILVGDALNKIMKMQSTIEAFISEDTLSYCYLSKVDFKFVFQDLNFINPDALLNRAKMKIKTILNRSVKLPVELNQDTNPPKNPDSHNDSLFEPPQTTPTESEKVMEIDYFEKFESLEGLNRKAFWMSHKNDLQQLFAVYLHLRSIPGSNSSVERSFSVSRRIFDDLKNSTSNESIESQVAMCMDKMLNKA